MRRRSHLNIFLGASAGWLVFWIAGLPDYYQQYSTQLMSALVALVFPPMVYLALWFARRARRTRALTVSLWLAFYVTVPLFFYDLAYCGWHRGHGLGFVLRYWYLTVYYVAPWLVFPLAGWWVERERAEEVRRDAD